jgi:type II secretion system protein G
LLDLTNKNKNEMMVIMKPFSHKGFTLLEILIVLAILGILATLLMANYFTSLKKGRDLKRKHDLDQVKMALKLFYSDEQRYPDDNGGGRINEACSSLPCTWGSSLFGTTANPYMRQLPRDPSGPTSGYYYRQTENGDNFELHACLEYIADQSGSDDCSSLTCATDWCYKISAD